MANKLHTVNSPASIRKDLRRLETVNLSPRELILGRSHPSLLRLVVTKQLRGGKLSPKKGLASVGKINSVLGVGFDLGSSR